MSAQGKDVGGVDVMDAMVEAFRKSLWSTWGRNRQTTDWPIYGELRLALEAAERVRAAAEAPRAERVQGDDAALLVTALNTLIAEWRRKGFEICADQLQECVTEVMVHCDQTSARAIEANFAWHTCEESSEYVACDTDAQRSMGDASTRLPALGERLHGSTGCVTLPSDAKPTEAAPVEPAALLDLLVDCRDHIAAMPAFSTRDRKADELILGRLDDMETVLRSHPPTDSAARQAWREVTLEDAKAARKKYVLGMADLSIDHNDAMLDALHAIGCVIKETP